MTTSNQAVGQQKGKAKKELRQLLYSPYLALVSVAGLALVIWGVILFPTYEQPVNLLLLALLAVAAQAVTTQTKEGVDFSVTSAISLAAVPLYGPAAAAVVAATGELGLWVVSIRTDHPPWKHALRRLAFNVGMNSLATFCAGLVFLLLQNLLGGSGSLLGQVAPWLPAALVGDQLNLWLLIGVLYLHQGVPPLEIWRESRWAVPINVLTTSVGGGFLALAVDRLGFLGLAIFFLPILLSAYAFRLYVNRTREQMTKLEELVDLRTRALSKVNEELAELHKEKDAFLAVLTHDMRTPLTTIHGYIDLLLHRPDMDRAQQEHILQILKRSERTLIEMVNNILEIRQLQSGAPVILERNNFDLTRLIADIVESIQPLAGEKEICLEYQPATNPIFLSGDQGKLQRVFTNLISNAVKYTPAEGRVTVTPVVNDHSVTITVADTGYGIPPEDLPHIFEHFHRVRKHQHRAVGTGLGLAIVKSLVEAHNGTIAVQSEEDKGSSFTIRLPL